MLSRRCVLLVVVGMLASGALALAVPAPEKKEDKVKAEMKKLQGTWQAVSLDKDGEKAPETDLADARFEIKDNKMIEKGRKTATEMVIDPTKAPKTLDLIEEVTIGAADRKTGKVEIIKRKKTIKAIYALEGDQLTICAALEAKAERPTKVASGKGIVLAVFQREKP